ncbi:ABC transporter permease [Gluconobacter wancherniae]|uniref:ABC transporter permease n=1 Tax=Gluconobacter wancherniae NBRC 103581 TaxID=656744 RepID=A0A511AVN5_9PROT|nr:ABC transporter permease [Gluconobacter wancherniae]MBF0852468.1 ABC transporter permease [Gluconobacter wancherniae]GBD56823.1 ABC transporter permease [Gluconobacter wancherniae NBRC 103581]GBR64612.1 inner-membrane translocator [Gluconobacter wancherniae NBRC 103581]GEK92269.1 ABC transporter permease [Gluconobacter wancherniae NBRC 103581]
MSSSRTRLTVVPTQRILVGRGLALLAALLIVAVTLAAMGRSPITLFGLVMHSTVGSRFGLEDLALFMTPLMLTGAAVWVGIRVNLWNIGAEGQFYAGATAATAVGLFTGLPPALAIPAMIVAGMAAGMAWIFVPAVARAWLGVSEIVTTLLLNFVASLLVYYLATGPWADRVTGALASTERLHVILPDIWGVVHWGFPLAVFTVVVLGVLLARSRFGYETAIAGANPEAARYAGISVAPRVLAVLLLSGGLAGLAGMVEVAGTVHRLQGGIANNYGYLGIVVALLARGSCLSLIPAALLMAFILDTGIVLQTTQISASAVLAITGLLVLAIAVGDELAAYARVKKTS